MVSDLSRIFCSTAGPDDITPIGQDFDVDAQIKKLRHMKFPSKGNGKNKRCFQLQWVDKYDWIDYSVSLDAVFCNTCRQFGIHQRDLAFTQSGFDNWKNALDDKKGFLKHAKTESHILATERQLEKSIRTECNTSISTLVNSTVLLKRRYYVKAIIKTIIFLAGHRLALRGDWDKEEHEENGLFNELFEFALENDPELAHCQKFMLLNATYKSPQIQNELIEILAKCLRCNIVDEVISADVPHFTILFDGTKDRNGEECISLAARFVSNGKPIEALLFFETTKDLDAEAFTKLTLKSLSEYGIDVMNIISQCYDGAAVMKGYKSGVAKRMEDELKKTIPYVHCFNHRLHLVIVHTVRQILSVSQFLDQLQLIYKMLRKPKIKKMYEGKSVKRVLETRWTGHISAANAVLQNFQFIVDTLEEVKKNTLRQIDGDDVAICTGILNVVTQKEFVFNLIFINEILGVLAPADIVFQKQEISYRRAIPVVEAVISTITAFRKGEEFDKFIKKTEDFMDENMTLLNSKRPVRQNRQRSVRLNNFSIESSLGERSDVAVQIEATFYKVIDVTVSELKSRFSENNTILLALSDSVK